MKTKLEIIEEIADFYNSNNRAVTTVPIIDDTGIVNKQIACVYKDSKDNTCAVGRYLINPPELEEGTCPVIVLCEFSEDLLQTLLTEDVRGHSILFWQQMQAFHDNPANWVETGISTLGSNQKEVLINNWKDK